MNILKSLIITLAVSYLVSCISAQSSSQFVLIQRYQTEPCGTPVNCSSSSATGGTIVKQNECIMFGGYPSIFSYNQPSASIIQTTYNDVGCGEGVYEKVRFSANQCKSAQVYDSICQSVQVSLIDSIEIPDNSIVSVSYTQRQCNGQYKDSFTNIDYQLENVCNLDAGVSNTYTCNGDTSIQYTFVGQTCSGSPVYNMSSTLSNECGDESNSYSNFLQFCNN